MLTKISFLAIIKNMKKLIPIYLIFVACFFVGCGNSMDTEIEFKGQVYYGFKDQSMIAIWGPLPNARVMALGHSEYATTDSNGRYTLTVKTVRKFFRNDYDEYVLQASGVAASNPAIINIFPNAKFANEQITVRGKPGETVYVRDFMVTDHEIETTSTAQ